MRPQSIHLSLSMKSHHRLLFTLSSLAVYLIIPACGGGGGGGNEGSDSSNDTSGSQSGYAPLRLYGKTLRYSEESTYKDQFGNVTYAHETNTIKFRKNTLTWTRILYSNDYPNGRVYTSDSEFGYTYDARFVDKGTIFIYELNFINPYWNLKKSYWYLRFTSPNKGKADVTNNVYTKVKDRDFTLE